MPRENFVWMHFPAGEFLCYLSMELNGSFCYNTVILSEAAQQRCEAEESFAFYGCEDPSV